MRDYDKQIYGLFVICKSVRWTFGQKTLGLRIFYEDFRKKDFRIKDFFTKTLGQKTLGQKTLGLKIF